MIEQFPGRRVEGDIVDEAARAVILERETNVEDLTILQPGRPCSLAGQGRGRRRMWAGRAS